MRAGALRLVGADGIGRWAAAFPSATLKPRSVASYASELNIFMELCAQEGVSRPLQAPLVVRYIAWVAYRGRNRAGAFQPYRMAIHTFTATTCWSPLRLAIA